MKKYIIWGGFLAVVTVFLFQYVIVQFNVKLSDDSLFMTIASFVANPWFFPFNLIIIFIVGGIIGLIFGIIKK